MDNDSPIILPPSYTRPGIWMFDRHNDYLRDLVVQMDLTMMTFLPAQVKYRRQIQQERYERIDRSLVKIDSTLERLAPVEAFAKLLWFGVKGIMGWT